MTDRKNLHAESYDASLSDLENKLRNAYVQKCLKAQIAEKKARRMSEELQDRIASDTLNDSLVPSREKLREIKRQQTQQSQRYRADLEGQMSEKRAREEYDKRERELERQLLIEVDRARELREEMDKARTRISVAERLMRQSLIHGEMKEIIRSRELDLETEEEERNRRYLLAVEDRGRSLEAARAERMRRRQAAIDSLARTLMDRTSDTAERRELLSEIVAEETSQATFVRVMLEETRRRRMADDLALSLKQQMETKEMFKRQLAEEEARFAEDALREAMRSEFIMRQTDLARRRKRMELKEELRKVLEDRERRREEEVEKFWRLVEMERREESERKEKVKEERKKLLREHSANVGEFVNPSGLTEEEENIVRGRVEDDC